jgi:hypothetical protein
MALLRDELFIAIESEASYPARLAGVDSNNAPSVNTPAATTCGFRVCGKNEVLIYRNLLSLISPQLPH